jgi:hypothetical protein
MKPSGDLPGSRPKSQARSLNLRGHTIPQYSPQPGEE